MLNNKFCCVSLVYVISFVIIDSGTLRNYKRSRVSSTGASSRLFVRLLGPDIAGRLVTHSCFLNDSARVIDNGWSHVLV